MGMAGSTQLDMGWYKKGVRPTLFSFLPFHSLSSFLLHRPLSLLSPHSHLAGEGKWGSGGGGAVVDPREWRRRRVGAKSSSFFNFFFGFFTLFPLLILFLYSKVFKNGNFVLDLEFERKKKLPLWRFVSDSVRMICSGLDVGFAFVTSAVWVGSTDSRPSGSVRAACDADFCFWFDVACVGSWRPIWLLVYEELVFWLLCNFADEFWSPLCVLCRCFSYSVLGLGFLGTEFPWLVEKETNMFLNLGCRWTGSGWGWDSLYGVWFWIWTKKRTIWYGQNKN